jgi:hypothetical protein
MVDRPSSSERQAAHALRDRACGALAAGLPFLVYLRTMAPTIYGLDSAELTTGAYTLGIVHPPGSPTYLLLGHLFAQLPIGDVGYRLNLMSAVAAALAAFFLHQVLRRLTGNLALALLTTWVAAFSYYFWVSALAAELYAIHAAFVAALLLLVLRWREEAHPTDLYALALFGGIGMGNHLAMVLLLPGFAWLAATGREPPWRQLRTLLVAFACLAIGMSVYLYLPIRYRSATAVNYARDYWHVDLSTPAGLLWMLTARMFSPFIFGVAVRDLPREALIYAGRLWSNFAGLGVVLGAIGVCGDFRRRRSLHVGLALLFAGHLAFYLPYGVMDKELMLLPTYLVWTVWVAIGARIAGEWFQHRRLAVSAPALVGLLAAGIAVLNFSRVDLSADWSARRRGEQILASMPPDAIYLGSWVDLRILEYLQIVEGGRPDVRIDDLLFESDRKARIAADALHAGRAVFTSLPGRLNGVAGLCSEYVPACDCYRVAADGRCAAAIAP